MLTLTESKGVWQSAVIEQYANGVATFGHPVTDAAGDIFFVKYPADGIQELVKLTPPTSSTGKWTSAPIHSFGNYSSPSETLVMDTEGNIYGLASGGTALTLWNLAPLTNNSPKYKFSTLYTYPNNGMAGTTGLLSDGAKGFYNETYNLHAGAILHAQPPVPGKKLWTGSTTYNPGTLVTPSLYSDGKLLVTTPTDIRALTLTTLQFL